MEAVHILNNKYKSQSKYAAGLDLTTIDHNAIRVNPSLVFYLQSPASTNMLDVDSNSCDRAAR